MLDERAVNIWKLIKAIRENKSRSHDLLTLAGQLTLANKVISTQKINSGSCISANFVCIAAAEARQIHAPRSRRSGCPDRQAESIDRIIRDYPHLTDDDFVKENLHEWLSS
jgi:hypothetical protein